MWKAMNLWQFQSLSSLYYSSSCCFDLKRRLEMEDSPLNSKGRFEWTNRIALLFILAIVAFYLVTEHRAHLVAYSGTILFVIFILLHLFMHRGGHGGCGSHGKQGREDTDQNEEGHTGCGSHGRHGDSKDAKCHTDESKMSDRQESSNGGEIRKGIDELETPDQRKHSQEGKR